MVKGIDYTRALTLEVSKQVKSEGYDFVARYLAPDTSAWKKLTNNEAKTLTQAGLKIVSVWETTADRALGGATAGTTDGKLALAEAIKIGQPKGSTIYFAVDFDATSSQFATVTAYLKAAAKEISEYKMGVYGSYTVVEEVARLGICQSYWQTYAWSRGKKSSHANIYQYKNDTVILGFSCDLNESYGGEGWWNQEKEIVKMGEVIKERIYVSGTPYNGTLKYVDLNVGNPYATRATDIRSIKFDHTKVRFKFVWEKGAKVSDLVKKYGADYGFNAPFFTGTTPIADCIVDGKILNQGYSNQTTWHGTAYKNGKLELGYFNVNDGYDFLFKTTPFLIANGSQVWDWYRTQEGTAPDIGKDGDTYVSAQRTFLGIDAKGDIIIAVSDGRTTSDKGLTLQEMALFMADKGAVNAINFDGGSSSVIADKTGMLNAQPKGETPVSHALLVFFETATEPTPETPVDWKQEGFDYLVKNYGLDGSQHKPTDPVDLGILGTLLKRKDSE
jgi:hypothetical protein